MERGRLVRKTPLTVVMGCSTFIHADEASAFRRVMLIKSAILEKIVSGEITLVFRRWKRASVKTGGTQMTQFGVLGIDAVDVIDAANITVTDAEAAGFDSRDTLLDSLPDNDLDLYRIRVHFAGDDPRKALRADAELTEKEQMRSSRNSASSTKTANAETGRKRICK